MKCDNTTITFDNQAIAQALQFFDDAREVVIISHMNADGDAVGSLLGSYHVLHCHYPTTHFQLILPNGCPKTFRWLPGSEFILSGEHQKAECLKALSDCDLILGVDFNVASRVDFLSDALSQSPAKKILCDHHHNPDGDLFNPLFSIADLSSCCELIHWFFRQLLGDDYLNEEAATCLYTGMSTDTGFCSYSCESPSLHFAMAAMLQYPIRAAEVYNHVMNTYSINRMRFWGFAISERLRIFEEKQFAYFYFSLEDQRRFGITPQDMEGLVNYTLKMADIEAGALLREEEGRVKVSLRSKYTTDVNAIARAYFPQGGGHTKAAGATSLVSLEETIQILEKAFLG